MSSIEKDVEQVIDLLREISRKLDRLQTYPVYPQPITASKCGVCGIKWDGPMGYVCTRTNCPGRVTC